jgi:hypothetical protein
MIAAMALLIARRRREPLRLNLADYWGQSQLYQHSPLGIARVSFRRQKPCLEDLW